MPLATRARPRPQPALHPAPRASHPAQDIGVGDRGVQTEIFPARSMHGELNRGPIRRARQPAAQSLHRPLPGDRQFAGPRTASQRPLRGDDIQFADLGQQVGDPAQSVPETACHICCKETPEGLEQRSQAPAFDPRLVNLGRRGPGHLREPYSKLGLSGAQRVT